MEPAVVRLVGIDLIVRRLFTATTLQIYDFLIMVIIVEVPLVLDRIVGFLGCSRCDYSETQCICTVEYDMGSCNMVPKDPFVKCRIG